MRFTFCFFLLFNFFYANSQSYWRLEKDNNEIKVFTRFVDSSFFKEFKASTVIKASSEKILRTILDGNSLKKWNYLTEKSSLLEVVNKYTYVVYMYNDLPWPAKNRDHVSELKINYVNEHVTRVDIKSLPYKIKNVKGVVRIVDFSGFWLLEKTNKGTKVTHQMHGSPGGYLPAFIVNSILVEAPYRTFIRLRELLEN